jgi:hypothetical protein
MEALQQTVVLECEHRGMWDRFAVLPHTQISYLGVWTATPDLFELLE